MSTHSQDKKSEQDYYFQKGGQDAKDGVYHSPKDSLVDCFRLFDAATVAEVTSAYDAGHSKPDSNKK